MNTQELIDEAVALPVEQRVAVVDSLLQSLNQPDPAIDAQWIEVVRERVANYRAGNVKAIPGEEVFAKVWKRLGR